MNTNLHPVTKVEHEEESEVIWIDRLDAKKECVYIPAWGDANALVRAAKVLARISWN